MDLFYTYINNFDGKDEKQKQHNAGRYIIEYAAKNIYNIENSEIEIINKKPKFKHSDIMFSISHSNEIAAVCFSNSPVGLDIEQIIPRDFEKISKRMNFKLKEHTLEEFYKNWTLYEAEIKLQNKVRSSKTILFLNNYVLSVVSSLKEELNLDITFLK